MLATWPRVVASGVLWAAVYNGVWCLCWFAFMRGEWIAAADQSMPWKVIWIVWGLLSILLGVASMAYVNNQAGARGVVQAALAAVGVVWGPLTLGMVVWAWQAAVPLRVAWLDSFVNLVALLAGSLAGLWLQRVTLYAQRPA